MSISSLFSGMEAYLDGDVEINNNVGAPNDAAEDAEIAEQTAEVASDTADATEEAKDTEVASQMLSRMCDIYDHVKQFGIDRTFVSLYNRHGELDRVCGIQFPSCESMDVVGDRYSRYSTAFIAAMEDEEEGLWAKFKKMIIAIWTWIKTKIANIWKGIKKLFGFADKKSEEIDKLQSSKSDAELQELSNKVPQDKMQKIGHVAEIAAPIAAHLFTGWKMLQAMHADKNASVEEWDRKIEKYKKELTVGARFDLARAQINKFGSKLYANTVGAGITAFRLWRGQKRLKQNADTLLNAASTVTDKISAAIGIAARNVANFRSLHPNGIKIPFKKDPLFVMRSSFAKWMIAIATNIGSETTSGLMSWFNISNQLLKAK